MDIDCLPSLADMHVKEAIGKYSAAYRYCKH